jgi:tetratricopeptide (TPR) repeat protein
MFRRIFRWTRQGKTASFLRAAVLAACVLIAYIPALRADFIWDDDRFLTQNPIIHAADGLQRFWFSTEPFDYFPLVSSMLWLEWRLFGEAAAGYHLVNVFLHAVSSILIWRILKKMDIAGAFWAAALFALHPVNVESVAWITERKNTLCMVLFLFSVLWYLKFELRPSFPRYLASILFFLLALLSKTAVVMWPFGILLYAWWRRGTVSGLDIKRSIPFFALSLAMGLVTLWFQYTVNIGTDVVREGGFADRLVAAGMAVWFYLFKAVLPVNLSFVYPRWAIDVGSPLQHLPWAALAGLFWVCWLHRKTWGRPVLFALGYYLLMLFPVLGFFDVYYLRYSLVADHWQYFSIIGLLALIVGAAARYTTRLPGRLPQGAAFAAAAAAACLLGALTFHQAQIYQNEETLWLDTISKNPGAWMAHGNLGLYYLALGRNDEAIRTFEASLRLNPDAAHIRSGLGRAFFNLGRLDAARRQHEEALKIDPRSEEAHNNLAVTLTVQGNLDQAVTHYRRAIDINPGFSAAHFNLGNTLRALGRMEEAAEHFRQALRLSPSMAAAHLHLGRLLAQSGKAAEARRHLQEALSLDPGLKEAQAMLKRLGESKP